MVETQNVSIEDIMASLDKDTLSKVRLANEISRETIPTASYGINQQLGGGLRVGKQHTFWGGEGSGKSALMMQTVALNQANGIPCLWIDAEHSFDPEWATRLGVDCSKMPVIEASTVEEVTDLQIKWIQAGVKLIVIDSTSALMPSSFTEKGDIKQFGDTNQMGTVAKDLGKMCKMIQGINYSCAVVHISQVRVDIGAQGTTKPFKPVGGKEVEHTDSFRVRLAGTKATDKQILGKIQHGEVLFEEVIGYPVSWFVNKNKITGDTGIGKYDFYKKGDYVGVDRLGEVLEAAVAYGVVVQGGAWFTVYGEKIQARKNVIKYLRENPEVAAKMEQEVHDKSV